MQTQFINEVLLQLYRCASHLNAMRHSLPSKLQNFAYPSKHCPFGLYIVVKYCSTKSRGVGE